MAAICVDWLEPELSRRPALPVYTHILASYIAYCIRLLLECCAFPSPSREHPAIDWSATYYQLLPFDCCSAYRHLTTACLLPSLHIPVHP